MINNRKFLLLAVSIIVFFVLLLTFLFQYAFLTVKTTGEDTKTVYISDSNGSIKQQYDATTSSKRFFLKRDNYTIRVLDQDRTSTYMKKIKAFSFNPVNLELKNQKESLYVGKSNLKCSKFISNNPVFYSCNPSTAAAIGSSESVDIPISTGKNSLKPTSEGFLKAEINTANLQISNLSNSGELLGEKTAIKNFGQTLDDNDLSISNSSGGFSIYSRDSSKLYIFKDYNDKNPLEIKSQEHDRESAAKIVSGNKHTYLIAFNNDNHSHGEADVSHDQEITVYDNKTGKIISEKTIPSNWFISEISDADNDDFILVVSIEGARKTYLFKSTSKDFEEVNIDSSSLQKICWTDNNSFYYVSDYGKSIYTYSVDNGASYLVYKGLTGNTLIDNVSCYDKKINFTIYSDIRQDIDNNYHYTLTDNSFSGTRIESILPQYFNTETNSYQAIEDRNGVKLIPYNPALGGSNDAIEVFKSILKENGVKQFDKINIY